MESSAATAMRIAVVGAGPAGLYFSILAKSAEPARHIVVHERNRPEDAYGFGVVFSDETLERLASADPESFDRISSAFRRWDEIEIRHSGGGRFISGGHGFAAIGRRQLLEILYERASALGVEVKIQGEIRDLAPLASGSDLVVGADGVNSVVRNAFAPRFDPTIRYQDNRYIWFGTDKVFDRFTFVFEGTPAGPVWAHIYPFSNSASTFIVETSTETWRALGLGAIDSSTLAPGLSDEASLAWCEDRFADHLGGHHLLGNNSKWQQFPTLTNERWSHDKYVLVGDAVHTAHFSVGSGTKLAMEDAVVLAEAITDPDLPRALLTYEQRRRPEVESVQRAAKASLEWFEGIDRYRSLDPEQFAFSLLSRSQRITYDNLRLRDPGFMEDVDKWYAASDHGTSVPITPDVPPMFHPFRVRELVLPNRIVVSPMAQYSATDGLPNDWHLVHLGSRAVGGAGLVMTEMVCVSSHGRISPGCAGLWNDAQADAWARIVAFVHGETDAKVGLQLGHAGRKGSTKLMWEGDSDPLDTGNWEPIAPSSIPYRSDSQIPREMTRSDMEQVIEDHVRAARYGASLGFDLLELHFAHGYLLSSFLSPLSNRRDDGYGGSLDNRMRFPLEVFDEVRAVWPVEKPISVRISATDWVKGGFDGDAAVAFSAALKEHGCDIIDVSTGQTTSDAVPEYGRLFQTPFSDRIRHEVGIPTMTVGAIASIDDVHTILVAGRADLCVLARPHLVDPYWTLNAAIDLGYTVHPWPAQYLSGRTARRRPQQPIPPDAFRRR